jgi:porin
MLLGFATIVLCVFSAQEALCQGQGVFLPPGAPMPAADSPLPWEAGLFGKSPRRKTLADHGFTWWGFTQYHIPANVSGGLQTSIDPLSRYWISANFDFEKMGWWKGGQFRISSISYQGTNVGNNVGTPYNPSTVFQQPDAKLFQLYYGQWFWDKQAHLKIGRIAANNEDFAASTYSGLFDSVGYNGAPGNMYINNRAFGATGVAQWGARLRIEPDGGDYTLRFGAYNSSETFSVLQSPDKHGLAFGFRPDKSTMYAAEYQYDLNRDPGDTGLPGTYRVGVLYDTGPLARLDAPGQTKSGNPAFYLLFDQMIYREAPDEDQGLWAFIQYSTNPDQQINPYPHLAIGGLIYQGLFPGRKKDVTGLATYYNFSSQDILGNLEWQVDLVHLFNISSWLQIGPEVQYIARPGGTGTIPDALILNLQTRTTF